MIHHNKVIPPKPAKPAKTDNRVSKGGGKWKGGDKNKQQPTFSLKCGLSSMLNNFTLDDVEIKGVDLKVMLRNKIVEVTKRASRIMIHFSLFFRHEIYRVLHENEEKDTLFDEKPELLKYLHQLTGAKCMETKEPYKKKKYVKVI